MRIISSFKDYYDVVQAYGQDQALVYMREPISVEYKLNPYVNSGKKQFPAMGSRFSFDGYPLSVIQYVVGFCGKVYPVLKLHYGEESKYCFNVDDVDEFVYNKCKKNQIETYKLNKWQYRKHSRFWSRDFQRHDFVNFFNKCKEEQDKHAWIFLERHCPIFIDKLWKAESVVTFNGCLKEVEFYRLFDPYQAFQQISMYLGGLAAPEKKIPKVSDADLIEAKGFDKRFSFRKDKQ